MTLTIVPKPTGNPYVNVLLYGPAKSGKTTGACSAPGGVLFINADLPNAPLFAYSRDTEGRIQPVRYEGLQTLMDVANAVNGDATRIADTVVLDTVGELHRRLLEEASKRAIRPAIQAYGDVSVHIERFCRWLCEAPVNVVLVCHEQAVRDEGTGEIERLPFTGTSNPALGQKLLGMVDVIGYTGILQVEDTPPQYVAQLRADRGRRGGDRFNVLGAWRPLDLTEWFSTINGSIPPVEAPKVRAPVRGEELVSPDRLAQEELAIEAELAADELPIEEAAA